MAAKYQDSTLYLLLDDICRNLIRCVYSGMEFVKITYFLNIFKTNFDYLLICINPRWPPNINI